MTATRSFPNEITDPSGIAGQDYADRVKIEGDALWSGVITQCGSVGGTGDAITAVSSPPLIADPANGQTFRLTPVDPNTTAVTIDLDSRGTIALNDVDGDALLAGDLVAGRSVEFYRHGASGNYQLCHLTERAITASIAAEVAASANVVMIGDTLISGATSQVEHTWTAGDYAKVVTVMSDMAAASNSVTLNVSLRRAGGAIISLTGASFTSNNNSGSAEAEFVLSLVGNAVNAATGRVNSGRLNVSYQTTAWAEVTGAAAESLSNGAADRVRVNFSSGNIVNGRVITYGFKAP